jgi:hypothetical protein
MPPRKVKLVATAVLVCLGQWIMSGCAGNLESGVGVGSSLPGKLPASFPFPGGVGTSPGLGATEGVATGPDGILYVSSTSDLVAYDSHWRVIWNNTNALAGMPAAVNHLGDIEYNDGYLYAPVESWNGCGNFAPTLLAVYSASTGQMVTWSDITADGHEASAVAVVPASNQVVVTSFCPNENGYTTLWNYNLSTLTTNSAGSLMTYSSTTALSNPISLMQGISWNADANQFAVSADTNGPAGSLWLVSAQGLVTGPVYIVPSSASLELEGVDYISGDLYYLESGYVYGVGAVPPAPQFNVAPGAYCEAQSITISDAAAGAAIYYTNDGSMPSSASTLYSGSIAVSSSVTISAIAALNGSATSAQSVAAYNISASNCAATSQAR